MVQYIEAPDTALAKYWSVFLGGGISGCPNWQRPATELLRELQTPMTVYNPRRAHFPMDDPRAGRAQIEWEFVRLHTAHIATFWFSRGSINPIVLFELGAALGRQRQKIVVGIDPMYERKFDVEVQVELLRPDLSIAYTLQVFTRRIGDCLRSL